MFIFTPMNTYLIIGLGNVGEEYKHTRHNIGFNILDRLAHLLNTSFELSRLAYTTYGKIKNKTFCLVKPTTFMNLSGKAVNYYLQQEKIPLTNLLVVTDDIALPVGAIRLRPKGSAGGHNGLKSINELLTTENYARLRFGIGNNYPRGGQADFVLGKWTNNEVTTILPKIELACEAIKDFALTGIEKTMNAYNSK
jgi:peptidyl-tRNA hydrolase, PTH1 family